MYKFVIFKTQRRTEGILQTHNYFIHLPTSPINRPTSRPESPPLAVLCSRKTRNPAAAAAACEIKCGKEKKKLRTRGGGSLPRARIMRELFANANPIEARAQAPTQRQSCRTTLCARGACAVFSVSMCTQQRGSRACARAGERLSRGRSADAGAAVRGGGARHI